MIKDTTGNTLETKVTAFPDWQVVRSAIASWASYDGTPDQLTAVARALMQYVPDAIVDRIDGLPKDQVVAIDLAPEVEAIPWELMPIGSEMLIQRNATIRSGGDPWSDGAMESARLGSNSRILVIGDPDNDLPGARAEAGEVARLYEESLGCSTTRLFGEHATHLAIADALVSGNYDVVHFAGHAWMDAQEAYIGVAGETHLTTSELSVLLSASTPAVLFLNSHFTAFLPIGLEQYAPPPAIDKKQAVRPTIGFLEMASITGVEAFVGCYGSPRDKPAQRFGTTFHRALLRGVPSAVALHQARMLTRAEHADDPTWGLYLLSGDPNISLAARPDLVSNRTP